MIIEKELKVFELFKIHNWISANWPFYPAWPFYPPPRIYIKVNCFKGMVLPENVYPSLT